MTTTTKLSATQQRALEVLRQRRATEHADEGWICQGEGFSAATMTALANKLPEEVERKVETFKRYHRGAFGRGNWRPYYQVEIRIRLRK